MNSPKFDCLLQVLHREVPERPTLFEFFLNEALYLKMAGLTAPPDYSSLDWDRMLVKAFANCGYDYATVRGCVEFYFPTREVEHKASRSMSETAIIANRADFEAYPWPDPDALEYARIDAIAADLPDGMKLIVCGPGGVLENVMALVGYEPLCFMLADDPELVEDLFAAVGSRLVRHYEIAAAYGAVGALISNDDWGFNTQTMLPPEIMRRYVFPWHRRIAAAIHAAGKPALLHSCGNLDAVMDDIIDDMRYDAKHSYEDKICPVEEAYERWGRRIATLGGIDLDFVCRATPGEIAARSKAMLDRAAVHGGYALGTGNSVPYYVPDDHYFAMIDVVRGQR